MDGRPHAPGPDAPNLYLVTVTVTRDLKGRNFTLTLSQMMLDPAVMGTAAEAVRPDAVRDHRRIRRETSPQPRLRDRGFTLLELLLASVIAAMLLGALYLSMNMTLEQTQASRDASDVEDLHRGVFNRMTIDLSATLGPLAPKTSPVEVPPVAVEAK